MNKSAKKLQILYDMFPELAVSIFYPACKYMLKIRNQNEEKDCHFSSNFPEVLGNLAIFCP